MAILEKDAGVPPRGDAVELCRVHLLNLASLVGECYKHFSSSLDPEGKYTRQVRRAVAIPPIKAPPCPLDRMLARRRATRRAKKGR